MNGSTGKTDATPPVLPPREMAALAPGGNESEGLARPKLAVVICYDGVIWELDWLKSLLGDYDVEFHRAPDFSLVIPNALYMLYGSAGLAGVPADFLARVKAAGNCGAFHFGDEFFRGPFSVYANFAYVMRTHFADFLRSEGVLQIPIGHSSNMKASRGLPASRRKYAWGLSGNRQRPGRVALGRQWQRFAPGKSFLYLDDSTKGLPPLSRQEYLDVLADSAFVPCAMGISFLETMRIYEALEYGAIPIVPTRGNFAYFDKLLGKGHPIPQFENWVAARVWAEKLYANPAELDRVQAELLSWWDQKKEDLRKAVNAFVASGAKGVYRAQLERDFQPRSTVLAQCSRFWTILRHHDVVALRGRLQIAFRKLSAHLNGRRKN